MSDSEQQSRPRNRTDTWRWILLAGWIASILAMIPIARPLWEAASTLENGQPLRLAVALIAMVGLGVIVLRYRRQPTTLAWTLIFAVALFAAMLALENGAERLHLVQYFGLGVLAYACFRSRVPDARAYLASMLVAVVVGATDELVQWLTPGRYWDLRDIAFNVLGAAVSQLWVLIALRPPRLTEPRRWTLLLAEHRGWWLIGLVVAALVILVPWAIG